MSHKQAVLKLNKKVGETPLECLNRFKESHPKYRDEKMTYAGRLDPLASGVLLVLVGEECKNKEKYLGLDKEYEVEVLFGFATDTGDVLGLVQKHKGLAFVPTKARPLCFKAEDIKKGLKNFVGIKTRVYPKYSSPALVKAKIQEKEGEIKSIKYLSNKYISNQNLLNNIQKRIALINGGFRQSKILACWKKILAKKAGKYLIVKIKVKCSSGVYMRQLAEELGQKFAVSSLAFGIKRTFVGKF